ncbi:hypothetical protein LRD69_28175 [Streptomyces sp. JH14]|uniref:hypothetical protein n=1 Tax=Streptomyces sp. JH14 TaxID=2793630 RepID=UPI0023F6D327|nr:hypothetical protein [Streptomyces sp. JH14]MDF6045943.1 hypothetical protein [Streptomyces sp. JH14]
MPDWTDARAVAELLHRLAHDVHAASALIAELDVAQLRAVSDAALLLREAVEDHLM